MFKKPDILVYGLLLAIISFLLFYSLGKKEEDAGKVEIYINNRLAYVYDLTKERHEYIIEEPLGEGKVVIENNSVIKSESKCRNKLCLNHGFISKAGEMIICIPNKSVVKIAGREDFDGILK